MQLNSAREFRVLQSVAVSSEDFVIERFVVFGNSRIVYNACNARGNYFSHRLSVQFLPFLSLFLIVPPKYLLQASQIYVYLLLFFLLQQLDQNFFCPQEFILVPFICILFLPYVFPEHLYHEFWHICALQFFPHFPSLLRFCLSFLYLPFFLPLPIKGVNVEGGLSVQIWQKIIGWEQKKR